MIESPFDAIKQVREDGTEFWSARNLMPLLGYATWAKFTNPMLRAAKSAENQGHDISQHFSQSSKVAASGPASQDYELTRFAAYLVAMNCDPNKAEVAQAQGYFAIKTREAEVAQKALPPTRKELALMVIEAEEQLEIEQAARREAEAHAQELEGPAASWKTMVDAEGDYGVADAAKVLSRDPNIDIGERRLFSFMAKQGWIYRDYGRWKAYQTQLTTGRLAEKASLPSVHPKTGELVVWPPTVRVTPKGLEKLRTLLGGSSAGSALALLA